MAEIGDIIRATLSYSHPNGSIAQNVFFWELQTAAADDDDIMDALDDWVDLSWGPEWDDFAELSVTLFNLEVDVVNGDGTVDRNIGEELQSLVGIIDGEVTSPAVAGFLQASTERAKSLGRKYVPGLPEGGVVDGILHSSFLGYLVLMAIEWLAPIPVTGGGSLVAGVLSRVLLAFLEFDGSIYTTDVPAYQRRRKPDVGS